ncbi:MAG: VCBS repeat-containing protein [Phaeodactylibacter sp.]|nr:VCBS repeat-containing protein [Phaeodactylibacter sp.]
MKNDRLRSRFLLAAGLLLAAHMPQYAQFVNFSLWEDSGIEASGGAPGGITVEDYDGDGQIDLLLLNAQLGFSYSNTLYRNNGNGFESVGESVLPPHAAKFNAGAFADFNGDGIKDLYIGAWNFQTFLNTENRLFAGDGTGMFAPVAAGPPVTDQNSTAGCSWADANGNGWLDIFVANSSVNFGSAPNALYLNQGNGTFSKEAEDIIVAGPAQFSFSGNWADVDGDKDLDLFVANAWVPDQLYYNDGAGNFSLYEDEQALFNTYTGLSYHGAWGDYDNDGDFDLFVPGELVNYLYNNDGAGVFRRVEGQWEYSLDTPTGAWGDYDNDGDLDLFVTSFYDNQNAMFRNDNGQFELETDAVIPLLDGFAGLADFNGDGFLDIAVANGGFPNTDLHAAVYLNEGNDNSWAQYTLAGNSPNTAAIGAVVRIKATINGQETWQMRQVASSSHSSESTQLHFGLGDAVVIDSIVIEWPDGQVEAYGPVDVNVPCILEQGEEPPCLRVGLHERQRLQASLELTPNPARGSVALFLEAEEAIGPCTISLFHLTGQLAWSAQQEASGGRLNMAINLAGLPAGLYYLQVQAGGKQLVKNLVITP